MCNATECRRCNGSGEIGISLDCRYERKGPVPEDSSYYAPATCPDCRGMGYVEENS